MHFLDGRIMVLERPDTHLVAARLPLYFVADLDAPRSHRSRNDRAVPLNDERAVNRQAKAFLTRARLDVPAYVGDGGLELRDAFAADRRRAQDRRILQKTALH